MPKPNFIDDRLGPTKNVFQFVGRLGYYLDSDIANVQVRLRPLRPQLGRWLCRDVIPVVKMRSPDAYLYTHNRPTVASDPSGAITVIGYDDNLSQLRCPSQPYAQWIFRLDNPAPCNGFIVQHVVVRRFQSNECRFGKCNQLCPPVPSFLVQACWLPNIEGDLETTLDFYEAFRVFELDMLPYYQLPKYEPLLNGVPRSDFSDQATGIIVNNSCGYEVATGELKFFCERRVDDLNPAETGPINIEWFNNPDHENASGNLPSTKIKPDWWDLPPEEGPAHREMWYAWNCCPGVKFATGGATPRSGGVWVF